MITPLEIENKDFSKAIRGYNIDEVNEFLDRIIIDLEKMITENNNLKARVDSLTQDLEERKKSESSVINTLESAKHLMNDISESAEKRAEIIIKNARLDADLIQRDARESVSRLLDEGNKLREKISRYREKYRGMLEDEINHIDGSSEELMAKLEKDFVKKPADNNTSAEKELKGNAKQHSISDDTRRNNPGDTILVNEKSLEEMLSEDFGSNGEKSDTREELSKTKIIK